jgi:hypothetical protein
MYATPMPFRKKIQRSFGRHSIAHLRAHQGGTAALHAAALGGDAFAFNRHIVFGATPDLRLAAHEAAHGVLQQHGAAPPGGIGREGDAHERIADAVAERVVAGNSAQPLLDRVGFVAPPISAIQMGKKNQKKAKPKVFAQIKKKRRKAEEGPNRAVRGKVKQVVPPARGTALQRLARAHARGVARQDAGDASSRHPGVATMNVALRAFEAGGGTQDSVASGAGPFQMSKDRAGQLKVTMRQDQYAGASLGSSMPAYAPAVAAAASARNGPAQVVQAFESGAADVRGMKPRQQLAVAALSAISQTAEEHRVAGYGKGFRALARQGAADPAAFKRLPQSFPMVESAQKGRDVLSGASAMHDDFRTALENDDYFSASSGDESDDQNEGGAVDVDDTDEAAAEALKRKTRGRRDDNDDDDEDGGGSSRYALRSQGPPPIAVS